MKVLFIVANDYPKAGACTGLLNNMLFAGKLVDNVTSVGVLACKNFFEEIKYFREKEVDIYNCILEARVNSSQYKKMLLHHPLSVTKGLIKKFISKKKKKEINENDVKCIFRQLKKIKATRYDVVVAVMGSFEVAAAAMKYKREHPEIRLVVYQVDPCSTNECCSKISLKERCLFEKELFEESDKIVTTPILFEEFKKIYAAGVVSKIVPMEFPNVVPAFSDKCMANERIKCLFTGNIYGQFRNPEYCLRLFDGIHSNVDFEMIGRIKPEFANGHKVILRGILPLEETKKELLAADVLVNIGNEMLNQVPSKIFEYISYGKPIINICKKKNCPTLSYFERYPYVLNLFEEDCFEEQLKKLEDFILNNYKKRISAEEVVSAYETCTPQYCAKQMLGVFNSIL